MTMHRSFFDGDFLLAKFRAARDPDRVLDS
jgi:hypothetical protein